MINLGKERVLILSKLVGVVEEVGLVNQCHHNKLLVVTQVEEGAGVLRDKEAVEDMVVVVVVASVVV